MACFLPPPLFALILVLCSLLAAHALTCPQGIFAFGDSLTDTGNYGTLYPSKLGSQFTVFNYQKTTSSISDVSRRPFVRINKSLPFRSGDGRLIIDFLAQGFGFSFINANYRRGQDFSHGVNYAVASATARDTAIAVPYYLSVQVKNFIQWSNNSWVPQDLVSGSLFFVFIGLNDFWQNYQNNKYSVDQVKSIVIPDAVQSINNAIFNLHSNGARTMMLVGVPAVGCLPIFLSNFGTGNAKDYDSNGCLAAHNEAAKLFNRKLLTAVQNAQMSMRDSKLYFADLYRLHVDVVTSPAKYGFAETGTKSACCGGGGKYGVPVAACTSSNACSDPSLHITWDGLHFTEGFNRLVASNFLKGNYLQPSGDGFSSVCTLDFSKF